MSQADAYELEQWLLRAYQANPTVPFHILAQVLKDVRQNAGR